MVQHTPAHTFQPPLTTPTSRIQIGEVRLVDGRFTCRLPPPPPAPPTIIPASSRGVPVIPSATAAAAVPAAAPAWDMSQQMVQLAILMLLDLGTLKGALYKGEILAAGGVVVLTARLADKGSHDQVRGHPLYKGEILEAGGVVVLTARLADKGSHDQVSATGGLLLSIAYFIHHTWVLPHTLPSLPAGARGCRRNPGPTHGGRRHRSRGSQERRAGGNRVNRGGAYREGQVCMLAGGTLSTNPPSPEALIVQTFRAWCIVLVRHGQLPSGFPPIPPKW